MSTPEEHTIVFMGPGGVEAVCRCGALLSGYSTMTSLAYQFARHIRDERAKATTVRGQADAEMEEG